MAEEPIEKEPTKQPEKETNPTPPKDEIDVDALMNELEAIGKTTPESIKGMHSTSEQYGKVANLLGDATKKIEMLESKLQNYNQPRQNELDYNGAESVDLGSLIDQRLETFWSRQQRAQSQAYQQTLQDLSSVQNDEDYVIVKDVFEEHLKAPNIQMAINSGNSSYSREYDRVVRRYYRNIAMKAKKGFEQLAQQRGAKPTPPHVESGAPSSVLPEDDSASEKIKKIAEKSTGTDRDIDNMLDVMLPDDDPMLSNL